MRDRRLFASAVLVASVCIGPPHARALAQETGVTWLIFVDDLHLDFMNTGHIRTFLRSIASELIRDGDAFVLRCSGPSTSIPFTADRSLLTAAIGRIAGNALPLVAILRSSPANEIQNEMRDRASLAGAAATDVLNADPSPSARHQAMLYVSNGHPLDPPDAVARFASAAQRAHVTVFAISARNLPGAPVVPVQGDPARWASYHAAMSSSLRAISEPTGGFAVLDETDFADALSRISRRMR